MPCVVVNSSEHVQEVIREFAREMSLETFQFVESEDLQNGAIPFETLRLVVLDLSQSNPSQVLQLIGQLKTSSRAPIVIANAQPDDIERFVLAGVYDYIDTQIRPLVHLSLKNALSYFELLERQSQQERFLEKDLNIAKSLQKGALTPAMHLPSIQIDGFYITSNTLGGDMYCWFEVSPHETAIILYDVMGHGVASSLITMSIRSLLRGMITRLKDPELVVKELNRHISELYKDEFTDSYLVTAVYLLINTSEKTIEYVNAGHPTGFLISEDGQSNLLQANTPILGLFPKLTIQKQTIAYEKNQRIILYTDGLQQSNNQIDGEQFKPYSNGHNVTDLQRYVADYSLESIPQLDDIALVFITLS